MTDLPVFLINLDGSDDRLAAAQKALDAQGVTFTRQPAFDGRGKDVSDLPHYDAKATLRLMGRALTGGEVGCFISHVEAAKQVLETGAPYGLVLEDDMQPKDAAFALTHAIAHQQDAPDWYVAHLASETLKTTTPMRDLAAQDQQCTLHRAHYFPMRTTALLWSRAGAQAFVESAYPITCPVDIHLRRWLRQDDMGTATLPALFTTTDATSEIGATTGPKRGGNTRQASYTVKRLMRMAGDKWHARRLHAGATKGPKQ